MSTRIIYNDTPASDEIFVKFTLRQPATLLAVVPATSVVNVQHAVVAVSDSTDITTVVDGDFAQLLPALELDETKNFIVLQKGNYALQLTGTSAAIKALLVQ